MIEILFAGLADFFSILFFEFAEERLLLFGKMRGLLFVVGGKFFFLGQILQIELFLSFAPVAFFGSKLFGTDLDPNSVLLQLLFFTLRHLRFFVYVTIKSHPLLLPTHQYSIFGTHRQGIEPIRAKKFSPSFKE